MDASRLYRLVYAPLSDVTHFTAVIVQKVLAKFAVAGELGLGPDFQEGALLAMALRDPLDTFAERTINFYGLHEWHARRIELADRLTAAVDAYKNTLGIDKELARAQELVRSEVARQGPQPD